VLVATVTLVLVSLVPAAAAKTAGQGIPTVYVDDSTVPCGDGTLERPACTIQEGIALLRATGPGVVSVAPGTYYGPVVVSRPNTIIRGSVDPTFDPDGFLDGFVHLAGDEDETEDEVVLTMDRLLTPHEDLFEVQTNRVQLLGVVLDAGTDADGNPFFHNFFNAAFSAKAEGQERYRGVVFEEIIVRGVAGANPWDVPFDGAGWFRNADVVARLVTITAPGFVGINPTGDGSVTLERVDISHQEVGVCFLGPWEIDGFEDQTNGTLKGELLDSRIRDGRFTFFAFPQTRGWLVLSRGGETNPEVRVNVVVTASGNTIEGYDVGASLQAWGPRFEEGVKGGLINVHVSGNTYRDNDMDADVSFLSFDNGVGYINDTTINVHDDDGVFGAADPGPAEFGNHYNLVQP
jgi:hypothetical protein